MSDIIAGERGGVTLLPHLGSQRSAGNAGRFREFRITIAKAPEFRGQIPQIWLCYAGILGYQIVYSSDFCKVLCCPL